MGPSPWGPKGAHGAQKLQGPGSRAGTAAFGPHGLLSGPMGWAPWVHGPYQILKETYQILKATYPILKETYQILKESYQIHGSMGHLSTFTRAPN